MSFVLSKETTGGGSSRPSLRSIRGSSTPATTWAFVTTRPLRGDPAGALDPEPARVADDPHDAQRRAVEPAEPSTDGSGAATPAAGPARTANGSIRASASISRVGGSSSFSVERMLESRAYVPQLRLAREIEEDGADRPAEREPDRGAEEAARDVVEEAQRAEHGERLAEAAAELGAERLPDRPEQHRAREPDEGQPARRSPLTNVGTTRAPR